MRKLLLLFVVALAALGLLAGPASAHDRKHEGDHVSSRDRRTSKHQDDDGTKVDRVRQDRSTRHDTKDGPKTDDPDTTTSTRTSTTSTTAPSNEEPQANGVVTIVHGVPDLTVDLYVNDTLLAAGLAFGDTQVIDQAPGVLHVAVLTAGAAATDPPLKSFDVEVKSNVNKTVAIFLDADGQARVSYFYNNVTQNSTKAQLTVRHLAAAPAVDVYVDGEVAFAGLANGNQDKAFLEAGTYTVKVTAAGDPSTVVVPDTSLDLAANTNTIVSAVGSLDAGTLTTQVQTLPMDCTESCP